MVGNYRPISLISVLAKIFERLLSDRLNAYLDKHKVLSNKQYGFRKNRSTTDALDRLTELIEAAMDEKSASLVIFVDLAKAFDTVDHKQLLDCLEGIGVRGVQYSLFRSYLTDRRQCVRLNGICSDSATIEYGVPQGTVLGPLLFNIYINSLYSIDTNGTIISFADDTAIFYKNKNWDVLRQQVESDFPKIVHWCNAKLLTINFSKTKFTAYTSYSKNLPRYSELNVVIGNNILHIERTHVINYLGVQID